MLVASDDSPQVSMFGRSPEIGTVAANLVTHLLHASHIGVSSPSLIPIDRQKAGRTKA